MYYNNTVCQLAMSDEEDTNEVENQEEEDVVSVLFFVLKIVQYWSD